MPFVDEGHCITKAQQAFVSIHRGIPCNLAPAHFTVHIAYAIKLRSRLFKEDVDNAMYKNPYEI